MEPEMTELYSLTLVHEERVVIRGRACVIDDRLYATFDGSIEEMLDKLSICAAQLTYKIEQGRDEKTGRVPGFYRDEEE